MKTLKTNKIVVALMLVCLCVSSFTLSAQSKGELLYQGYYTETDHRYPTGFTSMAVAVRKEILIYEDRLEIYVVNSNGTDWSWKHIMPFKSIQNGRRVYKDSGGVIVVTAVVDSNYNISCSDSSGGTFQYKKNGSSSITPQGGNNGGGQGIHEGGGNNPTPTPTPTPTPQKTHKCGLCDGTGRVVETNGTSFGNTKYCSECRKTVPDNHYHTVCPSCKGKGSW